MSAFDTVPTFTFNPSLGFNLGIVPALRFRNLLKIFRGGAKISSDMDHHGQNTPLHIYLTISGDKCPQWRCELYSIIALFNLLRSHFQSAHVLEREKQEFKFHSLL